MRLTSLLVKEIIQFSRDRVIVILILWLYTVEVVICTYALTFDVKQLPSVAVDLDGTPASRSLVDNFAVSEAFDLVAQLPSMEAASRWLEQDNASLVLVLPQGFQRGLHRSEVPTVLLLLDGTNSNTAATARGYAMQIIDRFQQTWAPDSDARPVVRPVVRVWYNPAQTMT